MNIGPIETIAAEIARKAHAGQTRRDGITPYITHPAAVAHILREAGCDDYIVAAAWLHDVLEDCPSVTLESLEQAGLPDEVIIAVEVLTNNQSGPNAYDRYLRCVRRNEEARLIKIADMLHNLSDSPSEAQKAKYIAGIMFLSQ